MTRTATFDGKTVTLCNTCYPETETAFPVVEGWDGTTDEADPTDAPQFNELDHMMRCTKQGCERCEP